MLTLKAFYFLRHGETDWNREDRAQGQIDIPLNDVGLRQARDAAAAIAGLPIATICTSPLSRARVTAEIARDSVGCDLVVMDGLIECNWGDYEGTVKGQWFEDWKSGLTTPPGAEPCVVFHERAILGINQALEQPGPVLIVAHGGVYGAIRKYARLDPNYSIPNAAPVRLDPPSPEGSDWTLTILDNRRST